VQEPVLEQATKIAGRRLLEVTDAQFSSEVAVFMDRFHGEVEVLTDNAFVGRGIAHLEDDGEGWNGTVNSAGGFERLLIGLSLMRLQLLSTGSEAIVVGFPCHGDFHTLKVAPVCGAGWR
jgi:hypothetical protein